MSRVYFGVPVTVLSGDFDSAPVPTAFLWSRHAAARDYPANGLVAGARRALAFTSAMPVDADLRHAPAKPLASSHPPLRWLLK